MRCVVDYNRIAIYQARTFRSLTSVILAILIVDGFVKIIENEGLAKIRRAAILTSVNKGRWPPLMRMGASPVRSWLFQYELIKSVVFLRTL